MCGITGKLSFKKKSNILSEVVVACESIQHRGPDERAYLFANVGGSISGRLSNLTDFPQPIHLAFGHCRLSIIDLVSGQQPMSNEDGSVWITYNGEVYNFQELQTMLEARGHRFRTRCDTEVIVHLYEEFGPDCVQHLRGQFAFAIWDGRKNELFLARDRIGIKPLYYYHDGQQIAFASELKAILCYSGVPQELDLTAVDDYLTYNYIPSPKTIFQGIKKLPPAHWLLISADGRSHMERYWQFDFYRPEQYENKPEAWYIERLREILLEAVQIRLISDVPLGAFLSGGIDSNTVVALMSQVSDTPVKTFTIGFDDADLSEVDLARQTAVRYGTDHHEFMVTPDFLSILPKLVHQFDEPLADASLVPTYYVSNIARRYVTVALSGDGGDESYAGYVRYPYNLKLKQLDFLPGWSRETVFNSLSRLLPSGMKGKNLLRRLGQSPPERFLDFVGCIPPGDLEQIWSKEARLELNGGNRHYLRRLWQNGQNLDALSQMQYVDFHSYLPEDVLVKVDRASMLNSLEVRVPLLDHKVLEFAATIPPSMRWRDGTGKYILRQAAKDLLPPAILQKPKQGFGPPVKNWFRQDLRQFARDVLLDNRTRQRNILNVDHVEKILTAHTGGKVNRSHEIWALLMLELWFRAYLDRDTIVV